MGSWAWTCKSPPPSHFFFVRSQNTHAHTNTIRRIFILPTMCWILKIYSVTSTFSEVCTALLLFLTLHVTGPRPLLGILGPPWKNVGVGRRPPTFHRQRAILHNFFLIIYVLEFFFIFLFLYVLDSAWRNAPNSFIFFNEPLNKESLDIIMSCYYYSLSPSLSVVALVSLELGKGAWLCRLQGQWLE